MVGAREKQPLIAAEAGGEAAAKASAGSPLVAYAFTVNFVFGAGVLGIPYAFMRAGLVLSSGFLIFITLICVLTLTWLVEVQSRTEAISVHLADGGADIQGSPNPPSYKISDTKYEINQMCDLYLGLPGRRLYEISLALYSYGALWLYAAIFASSWVSVLPIFSDIQCDIQSGNASAECYHGFLLYMGIFAVLVLPLICFDLEAQTKIQITLTSFAFFAIVVILATCTAALGQTSGIKVYPLAIGKGFGSMFTTCIFAQIAHMGAPSITHLLADKSRAKAVFVGALFSTGSFYILLGIICTQFFGSSVESMITLNWKDYPEWFTTSKAALGAPGWITFATIIKYFVIMYPVVSVFAAFPLYAINLGNNFWVSLPQPKNKSRKWKLLARQAAAVPPIVCAAIYPNVGTILSISGLTGFFIAFFIPSMLQYASAKRCKEIWGHRREWTTTPYSSHFSSNCYVAAVAVIAAGAFVFSVLELIFPSLVGG